ncbi:hypothetical protein [Candidatus Caldatribacterium sp.]|uniref:hypothetical protein n=1 Tax=Candidatus Caldatribacterium sp. TaxID=2282143 RepID=UPI00384777A5|nr:hypothetical protein [Candidatus Caldatribacterium sp.]
MKRREWKERMKVNFGKCVWCRREGKVRHRGVMLCKECYEKMVKGEREEVVLWS